LTVFPELDDETIDKSLQQRGLLGLVAQGGLDDDGVAVHRGSSKAVKHAVCHGPPNYSKMFKLSKEKSW